MTIRILAASATLTLLASCASTGEQEPDEPLARAVESTPSPLPDATPVDPRLVVSNAEALEHGIAMLRNGGVGEVVEGEPPHGDRDAELLGSWNGLIVSVSVAPQGYPRLRGEVVAVGEVAGLRVQTIEVATRSAPFLRFDHGEFTVDLQVLTSDYRHWHREESLSVVGAIACPSECGDLPPGADG